MSQHYKKRLGFWGSILKEDLTRPVFLSAAWHNLLFANYAVDPKVLAPFVPRGTEIDFHDGNCYISLVAFQFLNTKVFGFPAFTKRNFDEINLRFYVKRPMPRNSPLLRTTTAYAGQLRNLLNWIMKAAAWPFHTVGWVCLWWLVLICAIRFVSRSVSKSQFLWGVYPDFLNWIEGTASHRRGDRVESNSWYPTFRCFAGIGTSHKFWPPSWFRLKSRLPGMKLVTKEGSRIVVDREGR